MKKYLLTSALVIAGLSTPAFAQTATPAAPPPTAGSSVYEASQAAMGWSAKKSILGKSVYSDAGVKIGKVADLIIAPDKNVSYLIVGAGGFIGIGSYDVAVPVSQIRSQEGRLVMAGATQATLKAMPRFEYVKESTQRTAIVAKAERDIASARSRIVDLQQKTSTAVAEGKVKIEQQVAAIQADLKPTEDQLAKMKRAGEARWKEFEAELAADTAKLRKTVEAAV